MSTIVTPGRRCQRLFASLPASDMQNIVICCSWHELVSQHVDWLLLALHVKPLEEHEQHGQLVSVDSRSARALKGV